MSASRTGASRSSAKWRSTSPDPDLVVRRFCSTSRRKSRHSPASMLSAATHKCWLRPVSACFRRSSIPLLITHGVPTISHSVFCHRKRESINSLISPGRRGSAAGCARSQTPPAIATGAKSGCSLTARALAALSPPPPRAAAARTTANAGKYVNQIATGPRSRFRVWIKFIIRCSCASAGLP